ncbi:hypothetical protein [Winogradskyella sp.]|uniref:hypothetical protein n=1 Tax=Winogradskyella sp. TaxID=1883156 RepID=UPI002631FDE7|nr:hypothetical protein [Winogradskyella sp.]
MRIDYPPPSHWQDLEELSKKIAELIWDYGSSSIFGRQGQNQGGIDVVCYDNFGKLTGIQCKKRRQASQEGELITSKILSISLIKDELDSTDKYFQFPHLERFILGTTAARDVNIQKELIELNHNQIKVNGCIAEIWFWEDYLEYLNRFPILGYWFYNAFLKQSDFYKLDTHILTFLKDAFDRPAFHTPFHLENKATDFIQAIADTQEAIKTGILRSREDRTIYQSSFPASKLSNSRWNTILIDISNKLQDLRLLYTDAIRKGLIIEHTEVIQVTDHDLVNKFNNIRYEILKELNIILKEGNITSLDSRLLDYKWYMDD